MKIITQDKTNWKYLLILLGMGLAVGSFLVFFIFEEEKTIESFESPFVRIAEEDVTNRGIKSERDSWGIYRYDEYDFELEYPLTEKIRAIAGAESALGGFEDGEPPSLVEVSFNYSHDHESYNDEALSDDFPFPGCKGRFLVDVKEGFFLDGLHGLVEGDFDEALEKTKKMLLKSEYLMVDNRKALRSNQFLLQPPGGGGGYKEVVWAPWHSRVYRFYYIIWDLDLMRPESKPVEICLEAQKEMFEHLLVTFKFLD